MPHKVTTVALLDEALLITAKVAGACNAIRLGPGGTLVGDMFDGEGVVRGILHKGRALAGARALVVGSGGVGSAIVASLAKIGVAELALFDAHVPTMNDLADRLRAHYPGLKIEVGSRDPVGFDVVVWSDRRRRSRSRCATCRGGGGGRSSASGCGQNRLSHDSSAWRVEHGRMRLFAGPPGPAVARWRGAGLDGAQL
jgi:hypothetical protein